MSKKCSPVIKWVGGKGQLVKIIADRMPEEYDTYFEVCLGGAALFLYLKPKKAVLNDLCYQLMNMHQQVRDSWPELKSFLDAYRDKFNSLEDFESRKKYFLEIRALYNSNLQNRKCSKTQMAAMFIFLNKTCYNGVHRENLRGLFNAPFGDGRNVKLYDEENMVAVSDSLRNAVLLNVDFEKACEFAKNGDFLFIDAPYYGTYSDYLADRFTDEDRERKFELFKELSERGVLCLMTDSCSDFTKEKYKDFYVEEVDVKRSINCKADGRKGKEIIITNYKTKYTH